MKHAGMEERDRQTGGGEDAEGVGAGGDPAAHLPVKGGKLHV